MLVEVQNKRQTRCGIIYSDDMRRLFVGTNSTKEVTSLDEDLGQMGLLKTLISSLYSYEFHDPNRPHCALCVNDEYTSCCFTVKAVI